MPPPRDRRELVIFQRGTEVGDDYGSNLDWTSPTEIARCRVNVRFGSAQEKREAAQERGVQAATFQCIRSATLDTVTSKDRIWYLESHWDLMPPEPLDRQTIRFTATRNA